jgi:hypothetical protein
MRLTVATRRNIFQKGNFRTFGVGLSGLILAACASVRQDDLQAWVGVPVAALETHPVFVSMPVIRTRASDGTEIWNYVNGRGVTSCAGGGSLLGGIVSPATYAGFTNCMQAFAACNNIFLIRDGRVVQYSPVGTGGARCYTDERARPGGATGGANIR